jgi:hypothetical protein
MESETRPDPPTDLLTYAITAERAGSAYMSNVRRRIKKAKTFSILLLRCCYGSIAHNKLFSSKFDIWAPRSGFGEIPWTPSAHKLDHCTYLCTGRDPRSCARDTIILARHRYPHHHPINKTQILGAKCLIASLVSLG